MYPVPPSSPSFIRSLPPQFCCDQLSSVLGPKLLYPNNSAFNTTINSFWSSQEASLSPTCIVIPETPEDISTTISTLSQNPECEFAIKGQGHAPAAGFANIQSGITIDMTPLNEASVNENHTIASIGAGASWLDVYKFLDPLGVQVAGGRNGAVGVAGLTLGGGISYFAARVGMACDTVVNFEIVLPSGELTNANSTSHPDLFRALKGGATNFGIITRLDLKTFPQGQILAGNIVNSINDREAVFQAFSNIAGAPEYDIYASLVMGLSFNSTSKAWGISNGAIYTKPVTNPTVYAELQSIPSLSNSLQITNLSSYAAERAIPQFNWLFFTGTYGLSAGLLSRTFDILNATLFEFDVPGGIFWSFAFEPLPVVVTQYGEENGGNSLGVCPEDGNAYVMLLSPFWTATSSNAVVQEIAKKVTSEIAKAADEMGLLKRFQYINYANPDQRPFESYGGRNLEILRVVSGKYDSRGMFQRQVPGGFKLWP
ncbi:FAD binding domain protein [Halenospora varia]|nr:FAD binding domain protein [Halenospora varia]